MAFKFRALFVLLALSLLSSLIYFSGCATTVDTPATTTTTTTVAPTTTATVPGTTSTTTATTSISTSTTTTTTTSTTTTTGAPGSLDVTFGHHGIVTCEVLSAENETLSGVAAQTDGKVVAAGSSLNSLVLLRLLAGGQPDGSFGSGGMVVKSLGNSFSPYACALQADGRPVTAGSGRDGGTTDWAIARFNGSDGSYDTGFNSSGWLLTDFNGDSDLAFALAIQNDGKIVAAGRAKFSNKNRFALARYGTDGTLDAGFGAGGKTTYEAVGSDNEFQGVAVNSADGSIYAGGVFYAKGTSRNTVALAKLTAQGTSDATFGAGGLVSLEVVAGYESLAFALALQSDGKIVLGGRTSHPDGVKCFLARFTADGALDTSFGDGDGIALADLSTGFESIRAISLQPDGKIIAVGELPVGADTAAFIARFDSSGNLDHSFGTNGVTTTSLEGSTYARFQGVARQGDGKLVAVGYYNNGSWNKMLVTRYWP